MATVIENPVINSPYEEPGRHFVFGDEGITSQIAEGRRPSSYFIPIPPPKKRTPQTALPGTWVGERVRENEFTNNVRQRVTAWREAGYTGLTSVSRGLLEHWRDPDRERRLFFCQIEALETAAYLGLPDGGDLRGDVGGHRAGASGTRLEDGLTGARSDPGDRVGKAMDTRVGQRRVGRSHLQRRHGRGAKGKGAIQGERASDPHEVSHVRRGGHPCGVIGVTVRGDDGPPASA